MTGTSIGSFDQEVSRISLVEQCNSVLRAGGTVYLGETHTVKDGREICCEVLEGGCVQYLCLEFEDHSSGLSAEQLGKGLDMLESMTAFKLRRPLPPVKISHVIATCRRWGAEPALVDKPDLESKKRQKFIRDGVKAYRRKISKVGRGVLVLIGSDHLLDLNTTAFTWKALHEIVYDGLSFVYGQHKTCTMAWQLS